MKRRDWTWGASDRPFTSMQYQRVVQTIEEFIKKHGGMLIQGKVNTFSKGLVQELVCKHGFTPREAEVQSVEEPDE